MNFNESDVNLVKKTLVWKQSDKYCSMKINMSLDKYKDIKKFIKNKKIDEKIIESNYNLEKGEGFIKGILSTEPLSVEEIELKFKIDKNNWELTQYWNKEKPGGGFFVSANIKKINKSKVLNLDEIIKNIKLDYTPQKTIVNNTFSDNMCGIISLQDIHIAKKTLENQDIIQDVKQCVEILLRRAYSVAFLDKIIFVLGGDLINIDTFNGTTTSGTIVESNMSATDAFKQGFELMYWCINIIKQYCNSLEVVLVPGNHCYDDITECLTDKGWKKYYELNKESDLVASYNTEKDCLEYNPINNIFIGDYKGMMHVYKNKTVDFKVTPEHRILYKPHRLSKNSKYIFSTSEEIKNKTNLLQFKVASSNINKTSADISDDWLRLLGWLASDGSVRKDKRHSKINYHLYQSKPDKVKAVIELLARLGITYRLTSRKRTITHICGIELKKSPLESFTFDLNSAHTSKEHLDYLNFLIKDKYILPEILYQCDDNQIKVYLQAFIDGDGSEKNKYYFKDGHGATLYGKKELLEEIQKLCITHDYRAILTCYRKVQWKLNIKKINFSTIDLKIGFKEEFYDGKIWCLSTKNENLMIRRNGRPCFQGNCRLTSSNIAYALFRLIKDDNIIWNIEYEERKVVKYGNNMFCFEHGDSDINKSLFVFATEYPEIWGSTKYRTLYIGHFHKKKTYKYITEDELNGFQLKILPSLSKTDYYHYKNKWTGNINSGIIDLHSKNNGYIGQFNNNSI